MQITSLYSGHLKFHFVVESMEDPAYHAINRLLADYEVYIVLLTLCYMAIALQLKFMPLIVHGTQLCEKVMLLHHNYMVRKYC